MTDDAINELRHVNRALRSEYMDLLSRTRLILRAAAAAQSAFQLETDLDLQESERTALEQLSEALRGFHYTETEIDAKLLALANQDRH
jgi:hypothetical protein